MLQLRFLKTRPFKSAVNLGIATALVLSGIGSLTEGANAAPLSQQDQPNHSIFLPLVNGSGSPAEEIDFDALRSDMAKIESTEGPSTEVSQTEADDLQQAAIESGEQTLTENEDELPHLGPHFPVNGLTYKIESLKYKKCLDITGVDKNFRSDVVLDNCSQYDRSQMWRTTNYLGLIAMQNVSTGALLKVNQHGGVYAERGYQSDNDHILDIQTFYVSFIKSFKHKTCFGSKDGRDVVSYACQRVTPSNTNQIWALRGQYYPPIPISPTCNNVRSLPHNQTLNGARNAMTSERYAEFTFPKYPQLGVYVHEIFMSEDYVNADGNISADAFSKISSLAGVTLKAKGDDRWHNTNFDPSKSRGFVVLNFNTGKGYVVINQSTVKVKWWGPDFHQSFGARDIHVDWKPAGWPGFWNKTWTYADWVTPNKFRLRYSLRVSAPTGSIFSHTVDHQLLIDRTTGKVTFEGDSYPSTGTYRYHCNNLVSVENRQHQRSLSNLGDPQSFSYDRVYNLNPQK